MEIGPYRGHLATRLGRYHPGDHDGDRTHRLGTGSGATGPHRTAVLERFAACVHRVTGYRPTTMSSRLERPLRVGLVTRQYPPDTLGGIGTYVQTVAGELAAAGHRPVVVHAAPGQRRRTAVEEGVTVEHFPESGPHWLWQELERRSPQLSRRLRAAWSAAVAVRSLDPFDVIEAPEWKAEGLGLRFVRRGPVVVHVHLMNRQVFEANADQRGLGVRVADAMELWSAKLANAISLSSTSSLLLPDGQSVLPGRPATVVAPPIRTERWADLPPAEGTEPVVLVLGRLERLKAPETVVRALAAAPAVSGTVVRFVGQAYRADTGESYDDHLRRLGGELGVEVEVLPPIADHGELRALMSAARVVAVPSRFETLSIVALEAMAAGRPVVLGRRVGAAELVTDPEASPVIGVDDVETWARHLHRFLVDPVAAGAAGRRNQDTVRSLVPPGSIAASRIELYRSVIRGARASRRIDAHR